LLNCIYDNHKNKKKMSAAKKNFDGRHVTTLRLKEMKESGIKISCLTAYDALTAKIFDSAGIDMLLVGDSMGNVIQGADTTLSVTMEEIIYHANAVAKGASRALIVADMPFMSYQVTANEALRNAGRIMKETPCSAIKLEGGARLYKTIKKITNAGIPIMGHLGLTPQSINQFGSYRARGKDEDEAEQIFEDALLLEQAGAFAIVLEKIPANLAKKITESISIPTIGIGAGVHCDGQILVSTDMLGMTVDFNPRFVRRYANLNEIITKAVEEYVSDIRTSTFPNEKESY